jgi:hypothetical protein
MDLRNAARKLRRRARRFLAIDFSATFIGQHGETQRFIRPVEFGIAYIRFG